MFKIINGGVCAAKGYRANGLNCGLNKNPDKNDLGLYMSDVPAKTAGVYRLILNQRAAFPVPL